MRDHHRHSPRPRELQAAPGLAVAVPMAFSLGSALPCPETNWGAMCLWGAQIRSRCKSLGFEADRVCAPHGLPGLTRSRLPASDGGHKAHGSAFGAETGRKPVFCL